jgi:hypothetical protein
VRRAASTEIQEEAIITELNKARRLISRKALTGLAPAFVMAWAAMLFAGTNPALAQQNQTTTLDLKSCGEWRRFRVLPRSQTISNATNPPNESIMLS